MDHLILEFRCEKCKTMQKTTVTLKSVTKGPQHPTAGDPSRAWVTCQQCGHKQAVAMSS